MSGDWPRLSMLRSIYQQIGGEKDGQVFPSSPTHIGDTIPGAELVITPNAGHVAHLEVPELFYPPLLKFLR